MKHLLLPFLLTSALLSNAQSDSSFFALVDENDSTITFSHSLPVFHFLENEASWMASCMSGCREDETCATEPLVVHVSCYPSILYLEVDTNDSVASAGPQETGINAPPGMELNLFPNPASEVLTLEISQAAALQLRILGINGQVVREQQTVTGSRHTLSVRDLAPGAYFLQVVEGASILATEPFVKR